MEINEIITFNERKFEVALNLAAKTDKKRRPTFWVGLFSILLFVVVVILGFIAIRLMFPPMCIAVSIWSFVGLVGGYIAYLFVHELLRGFLLVLSPNVKCSDITFGVVVREGSAYCISKVPVRISHMRVVLLLPFILVSLPLLAYSIAVGDVIILIAAALSLTVNATDLWFLGRLRKTSGKHFLLEDKASQGTQEPTGHILKPIK
jgi:hypothetical protein